jgi:hypothetical protein
LKRSYTDTSGRVVIRATVWLTLAGIFLAILATALNEPG